MKLFNKKRMIAGAVMIAIIAYIILTITPNMFASKGIDINKAEKLQIVAHRGGAGIGLENTLSCIEKGIAAGAGLIEVDIHLTKDGELLVCHDQTIDRTTNGKGKISEMTLDEIRRFHIIDADGNVTNEYLPTLSEVMTLVNGKAQLLVEIKRTRKIYQGIEQKLMEEIEQFQAASWVIVQSFNDSVIENIHLISPEQRLEKLIFWKFPGLPLVFDGSISTFSYKKYHYISSFNVFYQAASRSLVKSMHKHGKEVKIWTVDGPENTPDLPVDGIITDRPDLWKKK